MPRYQLIYIKKIPGSEDWGPELLDDMGTDEMPDDRYDPISLTADTEAVARYEALELWDKRPHSLTDEPIPGYWVVDTVRNRVIADTMDVEYAKHGTLEQRIVAEIPLRERKGPPPEDDAGYFHYVTLLVRDLLLDYFPGASGMDSRQCLEEVRRLVNDPEVERRLAKTNARKS